mmetsp:Transcript_61974/g.145773  ORF Transcript_61974/g.145773 Transcript_61974/m.145773 type:complete len:212 (-) Transcript_61974:585-1220(-)
MPKTRMLMLPGKGELPVAGSLTSPPANSLVVLSSGSSWLYSTLTVTTRPSECESLQMPPTASPGVRGTHTELMSIFLDAETPSTLGSARKMIPLVSWKKTTHLTPEDDHFSTSPVWCMSVCTSPWPCGLVWMTPSLTDIRASLSISAGTLFCFMIVIWSSGMPKFPLSASSLTVSWCVSSLVMIASGILRLLPFSACIARMCLTYSSRKHI